MINAFMIVMREGFEAFLIVAIIYSYLRKTGRRGLGVAVYLAVVVAVAMSWGMGWWINAATEGVNQALWEGVLGLAAIVLVASLIVHMRRVAPRMRQRVHEELEERTSGKAGAMAFIGVFLFTVLMIMREGIETALMLLQIKNQGQLLAGALAGLLAAGLLALAWARYGHLIDMRRFFQVTSIFLMLFLAQVAFYTFHEFAEAGLLPNSEALHEATEAWSPDGRYGQWFSTSIVGICAAWLGYAYLADRTRKAGQIKLAAGS